MIKNLEAAIILSVRPGYIDYKERKPEKLDEYQNLLRKLEM